MLYKGKSYIASSLLLSNGETYPEDVLIITYQKVKEALYEYKVVNRNIFSSYQRQKRRYTDTTSSFTIDQNLIDNILYSVLRTSK